MEQNPLLSAEPLIPQRLRMRLIDWVRNTTQNGLQAETTVTGAWPLNRDGRVSSLICVELVAQAIAALSTWRRGKGARPRVGLLVGIKEAEFSYSNVPVMTRLFIQIDELYHIGGYAVFQGKVSSDLALFCKIIIQVMELEEGSLPNLVTSQRIYSWEKERGNGSL
jgi:predicted hotdog family 3-hydroxylacyl-ACP dehydratase